MSIDDLAERAGINRVHLINYETDLVVPQPKTIERLGDVLQTPVGRLLELRRANPRQGARRTSLRPP